MMKRFRTILIAPVAFVVGCGLGLAQATQAFQCLDTTITPPLPGEERVDFLPVPSALRCMNRFDDAKARIKRAIGVSPEFVPVVARALIKYDAANAATTALSQIAESATQVTQNGSSALDAAGTSLATKSASSILGIAEETGAVSSTTSGSSTTLTINVQQLANFLQLSSRPCYIVTTNCTVGNLLTRGASLSVSLSPASQSNGLSSLANSALSGLTGVQTPAFNSLVFKENLHGRNKKNVTQASFQDALNTVDSQLGANAAVALKSLADDLTTNNPAFDKAVDDCATALEGELAPEKPNLVGRIHDKEVECRKNILDSLEAVPDHLSKVKDFLIADQNYAVARDAALAAAFYPNTFSFEYDLTNKAAQPLLSTFKFIYGYTRKNLPNAPASAANMSQSATNSSNRGQLQITLNGSATMYNSLEGSTESRLRSAQGAAQLDYKPNLTQKIQVELSGGYYFQYMVANGLIDLPSTALAPGTSIPLPSGASTLLNTTGPIHIGQGKVTISFKNSNFKIPIAITGANRTDLIKADRVGGNFGISYDFSSLFSK